MDGPEDLPILILASRSPRRAQLLCEAGYNFEILSPLFDDPAQPQSSQDLTPDQLAKRLAEQKAQSCSQLVDDGCPAVILSADTICVGPQGQLIGQPTNAEQARHMIESFIGCSHDVVTGVALLPMGLADESSQPVCFADTATVWFDQLNSDALCEYLGTEQWRGKAGGYNLFDRQAADWPIRVETGDPATVVGLPLMKLAKRLASFGIKPVLQSESQIASTTLADSPDKAC